ncbi:IS66 family insertion sequence element accessory protein TnpB [Pseudomonas syringae]|uniref:IS66 family insertion sequence element accessory protein TnpB n=1 Tax=Pseudomonas syringae TaxID=317 RepID=UPI002DDA8D81|nr:IS66 family insertion sequence element accessory protein TnpB [Pseudomonas syringae]
MMRPDAKVEKVYLYPKPVDFRKSIDGLAALVERDIKKLQLPAWNMGFMKVLTENR